MPTYNPKQLGEPEVIREINATVLYAFLQPFRGYLRSRGLVISEPSRIDNSAIEQLVEILTNPSMKTPQALLNAVFYVEEMLTPFAADSLLSAAQQAGIRSMKMESTRWLTSSCKPGCSIQRWSKPSTLGILGRPRGAWSVFRLCNRSALHRSRSQTSD